MKKLILHLMMFKGHNQNQIIQRGPLHCIYFMAFRFQYISWYLFIILLTHTTNNRLIELEKPMAANRI